MLFPLYLTFSHKLILFSYLHPFRMSLYREICQEMCLLNEHFAHNSLLTLPEFPEMLDPQSLNKIIQITKPPIVVLYNFKFTSSLFFKMSCQII